MTVIAITPADIRIKESRTITVTITTTAPTVANTSVYINSNLNAAITPTIVRNVIGNTYDIFFEVDDKYANLKYSSTGYSIIVSTADGSATSGNVPFLPMTGYSFIDASSAPGDIPGAVVGDQAEYSLMAGKVSISSALAITYTDTVNLGSFPYRIWTPSAWGSWSTKFINSGFSAIANDPVIDADLLSKTQVAFGFDRLVEGYSGNTVNLRRASDSATQGFGFDANGYFDVSAVSTWASGSTVTVISFIDQVGGTKTFVATNPPTFMTAGTVNRMGTNWNEATGLLTPSGFGGVGVPLGTNAYFTLSSSGIQSGSGLEFHQMHQHLKRYGHTNQVNIGDGLDNTRETLFSYGTGSGNHIIADYNNGSLREFLSRPTSTFSGSSPFGSQGGPYTVYKKYSVRVVTHADFAGFVRRYEWGVNAKELVKNANDDTASSNANFSNGQLRVGQGYTVTGARNGQFNFGAIIVTTQLTDFERTIVQKRLGLIAESHLAITKTDFINKFDEILDFRDYSAGALVGKQGKLTLNFNQSGASWVPAYEAPGGLTGLRAPAGINTNNTFAATDDYFVDASDLTVLCFGNVEYGDSQDWWGIQTSTETDQRPMLGPGFDHFAPRLTTRVDPSIDTSNWSDPSGFVDACGGGISQAEVKYNGMKITTGNWNFTQTTSANCTLDALWGSDFIPTGTAIDGKYVRAVTRTSAYPGPRAPAPEQDQGYAVPQWPGRAVGYNVFFAATVQPNDSFDFTSGTQNYVKSSTNKIYASNGVGFTVGQQDASIGVGLASRNHYAAGSETDYKIRSIFQSRSIQGTMYFWAFVKRAMSYDEIKQVELNWHRLYEADAGAISQTAQQRISISIGISI